MFITYNYIYAKKKKRKIGGIKLKERKQKEGKQKEKKQKEDNKKKNKSNKFIEIRKRWLIDGTKTIILVLILWR